LYIRKFNPCLVNKTVKKKKDFVTENRHVQTVSTINSDLQDPFRPASLSLHVLQSCVYLDIYLGTRRGGQNCSEMRLNLIADIFKTVGSFSGFLIFQVFSFGLRVLNIGCLTPITEPQLSVWKQKQNN
jgi:hypothetical protein